MDFEANYGSSEYSEKAEEIFASYLLEVEQAKRDPEGYAAPDFEAYSAEHEEFADELYGLHADWDNVRGLVAQMNNLRELLSPAAPPPPTVPNPQEIATREAMAQPFSTEDVRDPNEPPELPPTKSWKGLAVGTFALAVAAGLWGLQQSRESTVLAQEKNALESAQLSSQEELEAARLAGIALATQGQQLQDQLRSSETARGQLKSGQEELSRDLLQAREKEQALTNDLASERQQRENAAALAHQAQIEAHGLALSLAAALLIEEEAELWPMASAIPAKLQDWIGRAQILEQAWETSSENDLPRPAPLTQLLSKNGPLERCQGRMEGVRQWRTLLESGANNPWTETLAQINNPSLFPHYVGINLQPQLGLVPLGVDEQSGLWRFADLQTGHLEGLESSGEANLSLVFVLVPGMELEGQHLEPFFLSESAWNSAHRSHTFGIASRASNDLEQDIEYSTDLMRLGYQPLSRVQAMLARPFGLGANSWDQRPVRSLRKD